jgi:hypothetical protein
MSCGRAAIRHHRIMTGIPVNVENFTRAETDRMFTALQAQAGGINQWVHYRTPVPLDQQTVIRMNRDTLYSGAIVDISAGATVTVPDAGARYVSVMIVNEDHYDTKVLHEPGKHDLTLEQIGTPYVLVAARILADPADPADIAAVNALQDQLRVDAASAQPFTMPDYDQASFDATRGALLELAKGMSDYEGAFGSKDQVNPVRHLIGTASGWAGCPPTKPSTTPSTRACRSANTSSTTAMPTASTTSPPPRATTGRSPSTSATAAASPTVCRSWTDGTTSSACTDHVQKYSTAPGPSPPSAQFVYARLIPAAQC